jgi:hypothetical protein
MEKRYLGALFLVLRNTYPIVPGCNSPFRLSRANHCIDGKPYAYYIVFLGERGLTAIGANDEYLASLPTCENGSVVNYDSRDGILFSKEYLVRYVNSYLCIHMSGNRFYIIRPENWSYMPDQSEFWLSNNMPRCRELWEKWAIFIKCCHPFSYRDMDFNELKKLGEKPVSDPDKPSSYTPEQDRNRILIELLGNRAKWVMAEPIEDSSDSDTFKFSEVS